MTRIPLRAFARLSRLGLLVPLLSMTAACGAYETTKIKRYRLHVVDGTPDQVQEFKALIDAFNAFARVEALTYVDAATDANSPIIVVPGLKLRTGKLVGRGQWLADTEQESPLATLSGARPRRIVRFSMRLEFDKEFLERHASTSAVDVYEKRKLFFHEVGHGLELDHSPNRSDLMYEEISGPKTDLDQFFEYVRGYMADT